ncbi:MAG: hypothetical protein BWY63_03105 [Chloroflexi bacterium ADurb.Bin360]|nr:MAG: hypothetical protein BWY63_03105 [Chloroflexi bacterium ADurb.Bin360]
MVFSFKMKLHIQLIQDFSLSRSRYDDEDDLFIYVVHFEHL